MADFGWRRALRGAIEQLNAEFDFEIDHIFAYGRTRQTQLSCGLERPPTSTQGVALAIGVPIALYLAALWLIRDRASRRGSQHWLLLVAATLILACSALSSHPLEWITGLLVCAVMARRRVYPANHRNSEI